MVLSSVTHAQAYVHVSICVPVFRHSVNRDYTNSPDVVTRLIWR